MFGVLQFQFIFLS
uniref:Uncharacterized protein n=1 Tax=Anguilla anguilla TaxID=7936 RepID=A0A0E9VKP8_ANGAN